MRLSPEYKLLGYCSKFEIDDITKSRLKEVLCNNLNWPYILRGSIKEGTACLLYNNLLQFKHNIPGDIWDSFKKIYYANMRRNIKIYEGMKAAFSSFNKEGLKIVPLKGIFLAENIYNNIALRPMTDIDLLVKKQDLPKIETLLEGLGYKTPVHKNLLWHAIEKSYLNSVDYFKTDENLTLHIHWHIVNVSLPTYLYTKNIKMERFWEGASPVKIADVETLKLAPHHLIIYLAEHALKHSFDRLILLSDVDAVIKKYNDQINWEELIKEAGGLGMQRQLYYALYFTNYFLNTEIPNFVFSKLRPKKLNFLEQNFFYSISMNIRNTKLSYVIYLSMVKGIINKLTFIFRTVFPPPSALALTFNLDKPKVNIRDYFLFLRKQLFHFKNCLTLLRPFLNINKGCLIALTIKSFFSLRK